MSELNSVTPKKPQNCSQNKNGFGHISTGKRLKQLLFDWILNNYWILFGKVYLKLYCFLHFKTLLLYYH